MKPVWQHLIEGIIFFIILGTISNILNKINVDFNSIIPAIVLLIVWTWVNLKINRKTKKLEEE